MSTVTDPRSEKRTNVRFHGAATGAGPASTDASGATLRSPARPARPDPLPVRLLSGVAALSPAVATALALPLFFAPQRRDLSRERHGLARARRLVVRVGRQRVVAWAWGEGDPVLMIHGWAGHAGQFEAFVDPLLARGLMPVAIDGPAHGASSGWFTNAARMADAVLELAETLPRAHGVIAHSFGAPVAVRALRRGLRADRLALVAPVAEPETWLRAGAGRFGASAGVQEALVRLAERWIGVTAPELSVPAQAADVPVPLLVVHDGRDREVPLADGERIAAAWTAPAELVRTDGLGHRRVLGDADVVRRITGFVSADAWREQDRIEAALARPSLRPQLWPGLGG